VCERCKCNGNIDEKAIGNCDQQTGACRRCVFNTTGEACERCLPNYWGSALTAVKCHACECSPLGTRRNNAADNNNATRQCDLRDGQCECLPNVRNRQCDVCKEGFWNIQSGAGCEECKCNPLGSFNLSCAASSGQCFCRPGVHGAKCDACQPLHYGFSDEGCRPCECDAYGTEPGNLQCDDLGRCTCRAVNFAGLKCAQCEENFYNFTSGCLKCDDCYNLVQVKVSSLRGKIGEIQSSLDRVLIGGPLSVNDQARQLQRKLETLRTRVDNLHGELYERRGLAPSFKDTVAQLRGEVARVGDELRGADQLFEQFSAVFKQAERLHVQANASVAQVYSQLEIIAKRNKEQAAQLRAVKETRADQEQNVRLQELARQARESAEAQHHAAQALNERLVAMVADAHKSVRELHELLAKYEQLESDRNAQRLIDNYELIKQTASGLRGEAALQKQTLEESLVEANEFIKRLKKFQVPDEQKTDAVNQDYKNSLDKINAKVNNSLFIFVFFFSL
jgi:coxsackievirus/adenovirus receptor